MALLNTFCILLTFKNVNDQVVNIRNVAIK
jgi:hypothetical protein